MVVVMTNFNGFRLRLWRACLGLLDYDTDLTDNVIPLRRGPLPRLRREASQRAFAGLSCGGYLANSLLAGRPGEFAYYGVMSPLAFFSANLYAVAKSSL